MLVSVGYNGYASNKKVVAGRFGPILCPRWPAGCPMLLDSFINPRKMSEIITRGELARSSAFHAFPLDDLCR